MVDCGLTHPLVTTTTAKSYCKFSHEKHEGNVKLIEVLEKEIDDLKKAIDKKETEIRIIDKDIINVDEKMKLEMAMIHQKN